jgi:hypothetical protein
MSLIVSNRSKQTYNVPNPEIIILRNQQVGFPVMLDVLREKKLGKKQRDVALAAIKKALPEFEDRPGIKKEVHQQYEDRIAEAKKVFAEEKINFYYRNPSNPEVHALMLAHAVNGEYDPEIFTREKQDLDKFKIFVYRAAKIFLVGWDGVATESDGKEKPLEFTENNTEYIPAAVMMGFANDIIIPYLAKVNSKGTGADRPVPN